MKSIAVVGAGINGLGAAYELVKAGLDVCLYEKEEKLGGHSAKTISVEDVQLDLGFMVFNCATHPSLMELFESLGVEMEECDMSFSVSINKGFGCEWGTRNGLTSLFAQKRNLLNPYFWNMIYELINFQNDALLYLDEMVNNPEMNQAETLRSFVESRGYSESFQTTYLIPMCASIWACPSQQVMDLPAFSILSWCRNHHHLFQLVGHPQWLRVKEQSQCFVNKVMKELLHRGCQIKTNSDVYSISTNDDEGCIITLGDGSKDVYDGCILAVNTAEALKIIGQQATYDELRVLGAFQNVYSDIFLHQDKSLMPINPAAWSACNFLTNSNNQTSFTTYWLNLMQNIDKQDQHFLVTVNPPDEPKNVLLKWSTRRPIPSIAALKASLEIDNIQGKRGIWFCGPYQGYGFHEGIKAGMIAAHGVLGTKCTILQNPKQMVPSWTESAARLLICRFLRNFISAGCLIILEDGGQVLTFQGTSKKSAPTVAIRVHKPQFYSKLCMEADLGLADAYINGDFSFVDTNEGLVNLIMVFIANRDLQSAASGPTKKRGWWSPMLFTAWIASAKYFYHHFSRRNTITQARRNISRHYDMSNEMFSLFMDETMKYSCGVFKTMNEDLRDAQLRKISLLIKKARIEKNHEVLEIGCGWGGFAIEVVRQTGCKYTGITLSKEQLKFAEEKVKEAKLEDRIRFLLCDYRKLPSTHKYNRIIACEMMEAVGNEYMEDFFRSCDSVLADDGLLVLQFSSIPDEFYDEHIRSSDFMREYIFPGGCLPSLSRATTAMANASRLGVEQIENIGIHYYQTLRCWRRNFVEHKRQILSLGFEEKFIRTWEYYFDYCAAGFKSRFLRNYQVVLSRTGNDVALENPYEGKQSLSCYSIID